MIASARAAHVARTAGRLGVRVGAVTVRLGGGRRPQGRHRRTVATRASRPRSRPRGERLRVVREHARFVDKLTVEAGGERYRAPLVMLDVGARAAVPSARRGSDEVPWLDNAGLWTCGRCPRISSSSAGGYIGCEMGQMFRRFRRARDHRAVGEHILSARGRGHRAPIEGVFRRRGHRAGLRCPARRRQQTAAAWLVRLSRRLACFKGSHLLVALGRRANTDTSAAKRAGCGSNPRGNIVADDFYATSAPGVYAVGDALGGPQFTHTSWDDHRLPLRHPHEARRPPPAPERAASCRTPSSPTRRWPRWVSTKRRPRAGASPTRWPRCRWPTWPEPSRSTRRPV